LRDRLAGKLSYITNNYRGNAENQGAKDSVDTGVAGAVPTTSDTQNENHRGGSEPSEPITTNILGVRDPDIHLQLKYIQEITALITDSANLNYIFTQVVEAIYKAGSFDRSLLCLLNADHSHYTARILRGDDGCLEKYMDFDVNPKKDLFSKIIFGESELVVQDVSDPKWRQFIRSDFELQTSANSFIVAPLRRGKKPVGFFYADRIGQGANISDKQKAAFMQFVAQARLALKMM